MLEINGTTWGPRVRRSAPLSSRAGALETPRESLTMAHIGGGGFRESTMRLFLAIPRVRIIERTRALYASAREYPPRYMQSIPNLSIVIWNSLDAASAPNDEMDSFTLSE